MPKEMTHFALAGCLARALTSSSPFYEPVHRFPHLFLLGAIAPDIPFYYLAGRHRKKVEDLSLPFHRTDGRALEPVAAFLDRNSSGPALALAAGVVCHLAADTRFHPLVYYYAGMDGVHPGATGRHRTFETAMDVHFWHLFRGETRLNRVAAGVEIPKGQLRRLLADLYRPGPCPGEGAPLAALDWHRRIQALFSSSWIRQGLTALNRMNRSLPEKYAGLVYPFGRPQYLPFFSGTLAYRDPCSGAPASTTLAAMIREAAASAKQVLAIIAGELARGRVQDALSHSGMPRIRPALPENGFTAWLGEPDIHALVYRGCEPPF
ncbi:MAG: zinc dependent phospholipase C family protein [Desulfobacter sp.]|nr:MAG: zinc dependent phospholipase C family protein [Desulfobacter sp.]